MAYSDQQRQELLLTARLAVGAAARGRSQEPPAPPDPALAELRGAFVTLKQAGRLRGCIGYLDPRFPLYQTVARAAAAAAIGDPRFPPVAPDELDSLSVEISVLTPLQPVDRVEDIRVGCHGLVVRQGGRSGLLLPQVPLEWGWDREQFLAHTCLKAGLPEDAWQNGAELLCFEAEVFEEEQEESEIPQAAPPPEE